MKPILLAALVALAAGCRKAETAKEAAPGQTVAGVRLIDYDEQHGAFSCQAPADWKAVEDDYSGGPLVMFMGPVSGPRRGTAAISVSRYPSTGDKIKTPQEYVEMLKLTEHRPSELETRVVDGRTVYAVHFEDERRDPRTRKVLYMDRQDAVLIPRDGGFYELAHTAPADSYQATLPVFEALVKSFRPKG
jgi:hypothetical protein